MAVYGYARVSTKDQNVNRQIDALRAFPVPENCIFVDRWMGADFQRPAYQDMLGELDPGDTLVMGSIDRLGRNYEEILEQWRVLTREKKADLVVLDMPLLNMRDAHRDLTGTFLADVVLQLLSYIAQVERESIRRRQAEGPRRAGRGSGVR